MSAATKHNMQQVTASVWGRLLSERISRLCQLQLNTIDTRLLQTVWGRHLSGRTARLCQLLLNTIYNRLLQTVWGKLLRRRISKLCQLQLNIIYNRLLQTSYTRTCSLIPRLTWTGLGMRLPRHPVSNRMALLCTAPNLCICIDCAILLLMDSHPRPSTKKGHSGKEQQSDNS